MTWIEKKDGKRVKNGQEIFLFLATLFYLTKAEQMPEAQVDSGGEQSWQGKKKSAFLLSVSPGQGSPSRYHKKPKWLKFAHLWANQPHYGPCSEREKVGWRQLNNFPKMNKRA